ncbi:double-strand break repair protein AddB, partial [Litorisediminicola beolgyonensis]
MFEPQPGARVFALAPGVDFARALVDGLRARLEGEPPEAMARVQLIVNTHRMARRIETIFKAGPPGFLPRISLVTGPADPRLAAELPPPVPALRRRLELTGLIAKLLEAQPDLAPEAALFDLADSLALLMDEMQIEGVSPEALEALDVTDQSGHWQRALAFLTLARPFFDTLEAEPDAAAVQRLALERQLALWEAAPPAHPVILAGSTGSRGTTQELMRRVAHLPQGAVIWPGFDTDMPRHVWQQLTEAGSLGGEDHPQYRFARLMAEMELAPTDVGLWTDEAAPAPGRNALISLALRPAPVTDQWFEDGPKLADLRGATEGVTLVEAQTRRDEALAIALRLRQAAAEGVTAALITPDRMLSRQVTAALDRFGLLPDDSAGLPALQTPPGRLLRQVARGLSGPLTAETLLALLKHPLTHHPERGLHTRAVTAFELWMRREGCPYPAPEHLAAFAATERGAPHA